MMKPTKELQLLIGMAQVSLVGGQEHRAMLRELLLDGHGINWPRFRKLAACHRVRPIVYDACKQIGFPLPDIAYFTAFTQQLAVKNVVYGQETVRLLDVFAKAGIAAMPYKGLLFVERLYANRLLRENADLDILVRPQQAVEALQLLIDDGYRLSIDRAPTPALLTSIVAETKNRELGLDKVMPSGVNVHVDFHWGINETYRKYTLTAETLFETAEIGDFLGSKVLLPSLDGLFTMLLNHHGARGCWVRFKDVAELYAYYRRYPASTARCTELAHHYRMGRVLATGNRVLAECFPESGLTTAKTPEGDVLSKRIWQYWEVGRHQREWIWPKVNHWRLYRRLQDNRPSRMAIIRIYAGLTAINSPLSARHYRFPFPARFVILNAGAKAITMAWRNITRT